MQEIITGILMSFDVVALYLLTSNVRAKLLLALWTALLHAFFPLIGFQFGEWLSAMFSGWTTGISSILLFFVGLQLLLSAKNTEFPAYSLPIIAILASIDTFSVSLSFGMLNLQKSVFIISAGLSTFVLSYLALIVAQRSVILKSYIFKRTAGIVLVIMSILLLKW
ncbi:MAG: manganese efflux pump [Solibacillus sp.]|uniref:manganese efflux pump n=1 Tax=Solibacillus sp. TaxID=1909654 RepID=UPI0033147920